MNKLTNLRDLYYFSISSMGTDMEKWKEFLRYAGNMYKYDFCTLVTAFEQTNIFTQLASYQDWKAAGKQVRRGERSIPVLTTKQGSVEHFFDASQLYGYKKLGIWKVPEGQESEFHKQFIDKFAIEAPSAHESFPDACGILIHHKWREIANRYATQADIKEALLTDFFFQSIQYMVQYRCGYIKENGDPTIQFEKYKEINTKTINILGYHIVSVSREILLGCKDIVIEMRREKNHERGQEDRDSAEWNGDGVRGEGRTLDGSSGRGRGYGELHPSGRVRHEGAKVLGREQTHGTAPAGGGRENDGDNAQDRSKSGSDAGSADKVTGEENAIHPSGKHHRDIPSQGHALRHSRGNRPKGGNLQLELNLLNQTKNDMEPAKGAEDTAPSSVPEIALKNYRYKPGTPVSAGGIKSRFKDNVEAIKLLRKIEDENRPARPEEQVILARYIGWGSMSAAFDEKNSTWANEYKKLKEILKVEEYNSARASTTTAFYTPHEIIEGIYHAIGKLGFTGGTVLDPCMATGNFYSAMPDFMMENSRLYGIELDSISGRIGKLLFPTAEIGICGYEQSSFQDDFFDLAVGNVPFGDYRVFDRRYKNHNFNIHDYFFAKTLDQVKPGGLIVFISSKGTLDKANPSVRRYMAERAELLGAIRLPSSAFKAAGTEVTSDIIFLRKRERIQVSEERWIYTALTDDNVPVNQYFIDQPEMLLGKMVFDNRMFGEDSRYTALISDNPDNLINDYQKALDVLSEHVTAKYQAILPVMEKKTLLDPATSLPADPRVKNFCYAIIDDTVYYRQNSIMARVDLPEKKIDQMKDLTLIRSAARELINLQLEECSDQELKAAQERLNELYDAYVNSYGNLGGKSGRIFKKDADYPLLLSLEYTDVDNVIRKADIFYKRTIIPYRKVERVENSRDGLIASVSEKGKVDLSYIADLSGRTMDQVIKDLEGEIYLNPEKYKENDPYIGYETADEYLCGNVRLKLLIAKQYAQDNTLFQSNVEALEKVQPEDLEASEIEVRLGTSWIDEEDYSQFIYELLETPRAFRASDHKNNGDSTAVKYNSFTSTFTITNKRYVVTSRVRASETYGTSRLNAYQIIEDSLNLKTVVVKDRLQNESGSYYYIVNKKETILAREKQGIIKQKFKEWFWSDISRREKYVRKYNDVYNNIRLREYDGSNMIFPGMNPDIIFRTHQRDAIARVIYGGNTLLAHCVGAGKTYVMIACAMELKRLGLANKSLICVPNHLTEQIGNDFLKLYPAANILVATKEDFEPLNRKTFIIKIVTGDFDAIIMGQTQFEKIPISPEREQAMIEEQISLASNAIEKIKEDKGERWSIKQIERFKKSLEVDLKNLRDSKKDDIIYFEHLGINSLFVDEAHYYKNCAVFSKMRNVAGISTSKAKKSTDMLMKCQYIQEINGGRGIVFATGTPISNSMTELFVLQRYLQYAKMQKMGFHHFDAWAANFGEVISSLELAPEGTGYRFKNRFAKFINVPELMVMFREVADVQLPEMLDLPVPKLRDGKFNIIVSEPNDYIIEAMNKFADRAEVIRDGRVDPSVDNMLKITNEARLLGTDPRLLDPSAPNDPGSKVNLCIENILHEYDQSVGIKGTQIVFCDVGTPNNKGKWSVYNYVKEQLVALGIPEHEICFIHDAKTERQREQLFEDLRHGAKRIIIDSTPKLGTGTNIQDRLVAVHHLDCPWRPSDLEQRDGRAIRRGNMNKEVAIYRYVTKNTFDAYSWQLVEHKQKFIAQIMTNKSISRTCEDIDETVLSYAEVKALATGNPLIKEKMDIDTEVSRLRMLKAGFLAEKYKYEEGYQRIYPKEIEFCKKEIEEVKKDISLRKGNELAGDNFFIEIMGRDYVERKEAGEAFNTLMQMEVKPKILGRYKGFYLLPDGNKEFELLVKGVDKVYHLELGYSIVGNISRIENIINSLDDIVERLKGKMQTAKENLREAKINAENRFQYEDELQAKERRQVELNQLLELDKHDEVLADEETDMEKGSKVVVQADMQIEACADMDRDDYDLEL